MTPPARSSGAIIDAPEAGDPPLPPVPEGAVMVTLKIARFNPENPDAAGFQSFRVPCLPTDRVLNLLIYVKSYLDGTLTFRRSCAQDRKSTRLNSSHVAISYAVFCLKKKTK